LFLLSGEKPEFIQGAMPAPGGNPDRLMFACLGCYYRVGHFDETVSPPCLKDAKTSHS
jgi:hypothetical protein